jgi:hypothetical protein
MRKGLRVSMVLALALAGAGVVGAQQTAEPPPAAAEMPQQEAAARALIADLQQLQQRLINLQQQALENSPELQDQAEDYRNELLAAMRQEGFDPMQSLSHIELIQQQLESSDLNEQERLGLLAEAQEEQEQLELAEQAALEQEEVAAAREAFMDAMLAAMRDVEPQTDELIEQLDEKTAQLQAMMSTQTPPME